MVKKLTVEQARDLRARSQLYNPRAKRPGTAPGAVEHVIGLQAQDLNAASLQLRARTTGLTGTDFVRALHVERSLVRTWCFRGTLHIVAAEDVRWVLEILGNRLVSSSRRRNAALGIDECDAGRADHLITGALEKNGPLTRAELFERLNAKGVSTAGQRGIHLLSHAGYRALICYGPPRDGVDTFALMDEWISLGRTRSPDEGIVELVRRYVRGYAPATVADFQWWSGLPAAECRAAWEGLAGELAEVKAGDATAWLPAPMKKQCAGGRAWARLLPSFDPCLLGYKDRSLIVEARHAKKVNAGGGIVRPVLVVDGKVTGTWKSVKKAGSVEIRLELFEKLSEEVSRSLDADVSDVGRYLGVKTSLVVL